MFGLLALIKATSKSSQYTPTAPVQSSSHSVLAPFAKSPASLVVSPGHIAQALFSTYSSAPHAIASHVVSSLVVRSPAGLIEPGAQGAQL